MSGALEVAHYNMRVVGVDDSVFRILVEQIVRVGHEVLIHG